MLSWLIFQTFKYVLVLTYIAIIVSLGTLQARPGGPQLSARSELVLKDSIEKFEAAVHLVITGKITLSDFRQLQQHRVSMLGLCDQLEVKSDRLAVAFFQREQEYNNFNEFTRLFSELWILCKSYLPGNYYLLYV